MVDASAVQVLSGVDGVDIYGECTETPLSVLEMLISRSKRRTNLSKTEHVKEINLLGIISIQIRTWKNHQQIHSNLPII